MEKIIKSFINTKLNISIQKFIGDGNTLKVKVTKGFYWLFLLQLLNKGLGFIKTIILARLLAPEHFGLIGIASIVISFLELFSETGFRSALIQNQSIDENYLNTGWTVSIIRGLILFLILFLSAPLVSDFFEVAESKLIIQAMSFNFIIKSFRNIGIILFSKNLNFKKSFIFEIISIIPNIGITILLAFILRNEWAIVWGTLITTMITTTASFMIHPYKPKFRLDLEKAKQLFRYGKWILLTGIVIFLSKEGDKIVITKILGVTSLGIYIMANRIAEYIATFNKIIQKVMFPAYSTIQMDVLRLKKIYLQILSIIALICIPFVGGLIILAPSFVELLLGKKWILAVTPIQIISIAILIKIFTDSSASLFNAFGKPKITFLMVTSRVIILFLVIVPLTNQYNITGTAIGLLISTASTTIIWFIYLYKIFTLKINELKFIIYPLFNTLIMVLGIYYLTSIIAISNLFIFFISVLIGGFIYVLLSIIMYKLQIIKI